MGAGGAALLVWPSARGRDPLDPKGRERLHCVWPQRSGSQTRRANVRAPMLTIRTLAVCASTGWTSDNDVGEPSGPGRVAGRTRRLAGRRGDAAAAPRGPTQHGPFGQFNRHARPNRIHVEMRVEGLLHCEDCGRASDDRGVRLGGVHRRGSRRRRADQRRDHVPGLCRARVRVASRRRRTATSERGCRPSRERRRRSKDGRGPSPSTIRGVRTTFGGELYG